MPRTTHAEVLSYVEIGAVARNPDGTFRRFGFDAVATKSPDWLRRVDEVIAKGYATVTGPTHPDGAQELALTQAGISCLGGAS